MPISIYIADDHPMFLRGLNRFFEEEQGFSVVGSALEGKQTMRELAELKPDIAILDLAMPGKSGVEIAEEVLACQIDTKILILTGSNQTELILRAIEAGVAGFMLKTAEWSELASAVHKIMDEGTVIDPHMMRILAGKIQTGRENMLTKRETEVLVEISHGQSIAKVAKTLNISHETTKTHVRHIFEKLNVKSQTAAVAEGIRRGIIQ